MRKSIIIVALLALCGVSNAQYFQRIYVPMWQGPKKVYVAAGYGLCSGVPTFTEYGYPNELTPDNFTNKSGLAYVFGIDLISKDEGFATGPYFRFEYQKSGWDADFNSELPYGYNSNFIYTYHMTCNLLSGTFGYMAYYHFTDRISAGIGAGLYMLGGLETKYSSDAFNKNTGEMSTFHDAPDAILGSTAYSNPFHLGIEVRGDISVYLVENLSVGLQVHYDGLPIYCSTNEVDNIIGTSIKCSENNRRRLVPMVTVGYTF